MFCASLAPNECFKKSFFLSLNRAKNSLSADIKKIIKYISRFLKIKNFKLA